MRTRRGRIVVVLLLSPLARCGDVPSVHLHRRTLHLRVCQGMSGRPRASRSLSKTIKALYSICQRKTSL